MTNSNNFIIRQTTENDAATILALIKDLAEYEKLSHEVAATEDDIRRGSRDPRGPVFVDSPAPPPRRPASLRTPHGKTPRRAARRIHPERTPAAEGEWSVVDSLAGKVVSRNHRSFQYASYRCPPAGLASLLLVQVSSR